MFQSHDPAAVEQLQRLAQWLERRVAEAESVDPELVRLKRDERVAAEKLSSAATQEYEAARLAHERAVIALFRHTVR